MFKKITAAVAALFLCAGLAQAADSCDKQAEDILEIRLSQLARLAGAAKTSFLKKCNADSAGASPAAAACDKAAAEKKLAGAAKNSFTKKCVADGGPSAAAAAKPDAKADCDKQAAEKKLAGAAKTSFTKKCVADAKG